jgi:stearoyl-CoA desaturase (Delta-9 desaturase)
MLVPIIVFIVHWYLSLFCQTFFLHRYAAHKMFSMSNFWEKYFSVFSYLCQGSSYLSPRAYAILHRMHHAFSDTDQDPHSPHHASNIFTMMWKTKNIYLDYAKERIEPEARFDTHYMWKSLEKWGESWVSRLLWGFAYFALYLSFYLYLEMPWYGFALLPIHFLMGPIHGAIVNWSGHKYGYANFDNHDKSKNTLVFDFLMLGELFQNNHHKLPQKVNFGVKWFEFDPTYPVIVTLQWLGIIRMNPKSLQ